MQLLLLEQPEKPVQKRVLVCGAGGFIGFHLVKRYKEEGYWVRGVDIKYPEFGATSSDEFLIADLRYPEGESKRSHWMTTLLLMR